MTEWREVPAALAELDDASEAAALLRPWLSDVRLAEDGPVFAERFACLAEVARLAEDPQLAQTVAQLRADDADSCYALAYDAYERGLYDLGVVALLRADRLRPDDSSILSELSANWDALRDHVSAAAKLNGSARRTPLLSYLLAYHQLMSGHPQQAGVTLAEMSAPDHPDVEFMVQRLQGVLRRAQALAPWLERDPLRAWHAVLHGSLLLHLSPYGFDEPMRGRYGYVHDTPELCREGIRLLGVALEALKLRPPCVLLLPDPGSRALGLATARLLGLPSEEYSERPGLVVAYDLDEVTPDIAASLSQHVAGQLLWAHTSNWTDPFPFAPDFTTFLCQTRTAPWEEGMGLDDEDDPVEEEDEDAGPSFEEVLEQIVSDADSASGEVESQGGVAGLQQFLTAFAALPLAAPGRNEGHRERQRAGSPVPSASFG